ncbi:tautomerase family protein [Kordiimonas pumila]|uniref:Tautomerase n=1 Tax=Kordiimonas pumila TaxID=2161677 RepID=A0ABV7D7J9_9PROT|nr:2-hydroxymuconate tautomerase family protein [Kordiimonas pumila]
MPIVQISMVKGRSHESKNRMMKEISWIVSECAEVKLEAVRVLITEVDAEHWSVGGVLKSQTVNNGHR